MLRWPSRAFWRIKIIAFVVLFPALIALAFVALYAGGMRAFGPGANTSGTALEQSGGLIVSLPMPPMEEFPTSHMLINLIIAISVNAPCGRGSPRLRSR